MSLVTVEDTEVLANQLPLDAEAKDIRPNPLFTFADIVVTGALLGGGADGLHKIVSVFTTWAEETKKKTQNTD